ncbi:MAG: 3D domain-containing protein [Nanoarchaeota archaeon]
MKKGSLTMGVKALIYLVIAIILIFGVGNFAVQLFKSVFGTDGECAGTDYIVDEMQEIVDSIKAGEVNYGVRLFYIRSGCSLIGFDSVRVSKNQRPFECEGQTCLCVCATEKKQVKVLGFVPWLKTSSSCEKYSHCHIFEDEKAIRDEIKINNFGVLEPLLGNDFELFANKKAPYYINYLSKIIYISKDNLYDDLTVFQTPGQVPGQAFIEGQTEEFIQVNFEALGITQQDIDIAKVDPSKRMEILAKYNVDPKLLMGGIAPSVRTYSIPGAPADSLAYLDVGVDSIRVDGNVIQANNPQSWPKSEFFRHTKPLEGSSLNMLLSHYVTAYEGDYNTWTTTNEEKLGGTAACVKYPKGFYEAVKCQGSGVDNNFITYTYKCIKHDSTGCNDPPTDILGKTTVNTGPRAFKTIAVNIQDGTECYIPLGSYVYIEPKSGYDNGEWTGWYIAEDTGSYTIDSRCQIDIYAGLGEIAEGLSLPDSADSTNLFDVWVYNPSGEQIVYDSTNMMV